MSAADLSLTRVLYAPPSLVWRAWTEPAYFEQWFAPAPVKTRVINMQVEAGGSFDTEMTLPDGKVIASTGCFLAVDPERLIIFTDALQGGWRPNGEPFMTAMITLSPHPEGTEYRVRVLHKDDADRLRHEEMGFQTGWGAALDQLDSLLGGMS